MSTDEFGNTASGNAVPGLRSAEERPRQLTHIDENNQPKMVDISAKPVSARQATARSVVTLPADCFVFSEEGESYGKKGPILSTAIVAGTLAAKKTAEWIPFCHPVFLDACDFSCTARNPHCLEIFCTVKTRSPTGVEMEALVGAAAAALVVFDMCKALSSDIVVGPIEVVEKKGGKHDYSRSPL